MFEQRYAGWLVLGALGGVLSASAGCSSSAPSPAPPPVAAPQAGTQSAAAQSKAAAPKADSPSFATPAEAVEQWLAAYRDEGEQGHRRLTFDQTGQPEEQWKKLLADHYDAPVKAGDVQILETLERDNAAAVIVRLGERVGHFSLYHDGDGWHLCRTIENWDAIQAPSEYRGIVKTVFNLSGDVAVKKISWHERLAAERSADKADPSR